MSLSGGVFHQSRISRAVAERGPITESDLDLAAKGDDVLPARRRMPVDEMAWRPFPEVDRLGGLRVTQFRMIGQAGFFDVRLAVVSRVERNIAMGVLAQNGRRCPGVAIYRQLVAGT